MPSIINASSTSTSGLVYSADATGVLQLQSNGVTGLTVGSGGLVTAANGMVFSSMTLGSATAGEFEYDGRVPYFTPLGTQRGVVPGMQYYRLDSALVGSNVNTAQNIFGVGVTVSAGTVYNYEIRAAFTKSAGTTSHALQFGFGGTATVNNIFSDMRVTFTSTGINSAITGSTTQGAVSTQAGFVTVTNTSATAGLLCSMAISGSVSINAGGTFIPQYQLTAAPGGAYTTLAGAYVIIYPVGASGSNVGVGTWA